jgi:hypothetical protein
MITEIAFNLFLGFGVVSMFLVFYHLWRLDHNIREDKRTLAFFLMDFVPFMPGVLTEKGKYHRRRAGWYLVCALLFFAVTIFIDSYRRGLIHGSP